ncbi:hypothetical protein [Streptomyces sp. NPDC057702]|uniref:hypothetical protein n=1 Tax=unclassified Streptomyces TaxID=2593676 RepID=UPI00367ABB8A
MPRSAYFGGLGGLSAHQESALLDLRGTGHSARPPDPISLRLDRQVGDIDAPCVAPDRLPGRVSRPS